MLNLRSKAWSDENGTTVIEFAIVAPAFIVLVIGLLYTGLALFTVGSLHYAVEEGARCASVKSAVCDDATATLAYTKRHYYGPSASPAFTYAALACGNSVSGSTDYEMNFGLTKVSVPLSATACFP